MNFQEAFELQIKDANILTEEHTASFTGTKLSPGDFLLFTLYRDKNELRITSIANTDEAYMDKHFRFNNYYDSAMPMITR